MICCSQEKWSEVRTGGKGLVSTLTSCTACGGSCSLREDGCIVHPERMADHFFVCLGVLSLSENSVLLVPKGPLRP